MKKLLCTMLIVVTSLAMIFALTGCNNTTDKGDSYIKEYKAALPMPNLESAKMGKENANSDGWYMTMDDNFDGAVLPEYWRPVVSNKRGENTYWCPETYSLEGGNLVMRMEKAEEHKCSTPHNAERKVITTCIDTSSRTDENGNVELGFMQAFGYYEIRCKIPDTDGGWASFWLQNPNEGRIGDKGVDASEIDVFESSFYRNKTNVGSCIHYDGYADKHHSLGGVHDVGVDTYEGFHTYAVKWTPTEYVFYFDGEPTWATDGDGICVTPDFLRLSCHATDHSRGPYAQRLDIDNFVSSEFVVDYVRVYQNTSYEPYIKSIDSFKN